MPITVSYDLSNLKDQNDRTYLRSMFERFGFQRLGGSVFRYPCQGQTGMEDWLNHVVPALMFFRSYALARGIQIKVLTIDAHSVSFLDQSDPAAVAGHPPVSADHVNWALPTNSQCPDADVRNWLDSVTQVHH